MKMTESLFVVRGATEGGDKIRAGVVRSVDARTDDSKLEVIGCWKFRHPRCRVTIALIGSTSRTLSKYSMS